MTAQSRDGTGTEFSKWLRNQDELDSKKYKFTCSNIDFIWSNYEIGLWMLIEEKRHKCWPAFSQEKLFKSLHTSINDRNYRGFHYIVFENKSPDDGLIFLKRNFGKIEIITKEELMNFLKFIDIPKSTQ